MLFSNRRLNPVPVSQPLTEPLERRVLLSTSAGPPDSPLLVADMDGDGKQDLIIVVRQGAGTDKPLTTITVLDPDSDGDGLTAKSFSLPQVQDEVLLGDFNGDGRPDLLVSAIDRPGGRPGGRPVGARTTLSVLFNDGKGGFDPGSRLFAVWPHMHQVGKRIGDLDGDGRDDIVIEREIATRSGLVARRVYTSLISKGDGTFEKQKSIVFPHVLEVNRLADLDGDGRADFVVTIKSPRDSASGQATGRRESSGLVIGIGDGRGGFTFGPVFIIPCIFELVVADFDGDGLPNVMALTGRPVGQPAAAGLGAHVQRYNRQSGFTLSRPFPLPEGLPTLRIGAGDVNGDGRADLVAHDATAAGFGINEQGVGFSYFGINEQGVRIAAARSADIDGDRREDLVVLAGDGSVLVARNATGDDGTVRFDRYQTLYKPTA